MLAVIACLVFVIALIGWSLGPLNLLYLGLALLAAHLAWGWAGPVLQSRRRRP